ncbi:hypothetical protein [Microbacterium sp.]|uniref:hypothetical protein n=1 Tax=Microbacterium sp. TaxID=51671 RepID=UPI0028A5D9A8|nr:hypothetical protein [Microbacterium sp.]
MATGDLEGANVMNHPRPGRAAARPAAAFDLLGFSAACMVGVISGSTVAALMIPNDLINVVRVLVTYVALATIPLLVAIVLVGIPLKILSARRRVATHRLGTLGLLIGLALAAVVPIIVALATGIPMGWSALMAGLPIAWCALAALILTLPLGARPGLSKAIALVYALVVLVGGVWFAMQVA